MNVEVLLWLYVTAFYYVRIFYLCLVLVQNYVVCYITPFEP